MNIFPNDPLYLKKSIALNSIGIHTQKRKRKKQKRKRKKKWKERTANFYFEAVHSGAVNLFRDHHV